MENHHPKEGKVLMVFFHPNLSCKTLVIFGEERITGLRTNVFTLEAI